jgi:hypothetical protein
MKSTSDEEKEELLNRIVDSLNPNKPPQLHEITSFSSIIAPPATSYFVPPARIPTEEPGSPLGIKTLLPSRQTEVRKNTLLLLQGCIGAESGPNPKVHNSKSLLDSWKNLVKVSLECQNIQPTSYTEEEVQNNLLNLLTARRELRDKLIIATRITELATWNERGVMPEDRIDEYAINLEFSGPFTQYLQGEESRREQIALQAMLERTGKLVQIQLTESKNHVHELETKLNSKENDLLEATTKIATLDIQCINFQDQVQKLKAEMSEKLQEVADQTELKIRRELAPWGKDDTAKSDPDNLEYLIMTNTPLALDTLVKRQQQLETIQHLVDEMKHSIGIPINMGDEPSSIVFSRQGAPYQLSQIPLEETKEADDVHSEKMDDEVTEKVVDEQSFEKPELSGDIDNSENINVVNEKPSEEANDVEMEEDELLDKNSSDNGLNLNDEEKLLEGGPKLNVPQYSEDPLALGLNSLEAGESMLSDLQPSQTDLADLSNTY